VDVVPCRQLFTYCARSHKDPCLGQGCSCYIMADLVDIANEHRVSIHSFADDTQLYLCCGRNETASTIVRLQQYIPDINHWMSANRLKLNVDKTELLWVGTKHSLLLGGGRFPSLQLTADIIHPSQHVKVFGVVTSADLGLEQHATNVSATCFYHLRQLRHIRRALSKESATTLVHAFVISRVDYCSVVFAGLQSQPPTSCNE